MRKACRQQWVEDADLLEKEKSHFWAPVGRFGWSDRHYPENHISNVVEAEIATMGNDWSPLKAGLFDASADRVRSVKGFLDERVNKLGWGW